MTITFTTRDKILLLVLAIILFVGMMYLYGVMPADEEAEELAATATTKQQELAQLQAQIAAIDINSVDKEYNELLDYYYTTKSELTGTDTLPSQIGIIAIERKVVKMLEDLGIKGYSTIGWKISEEKFSQSFNGYTAEYYVAQAVCATPFKTTPDKIATFIERIRTDDFFTLTELNIRYETETVTEENPDDPENPISVSTEVASGNFTLVYYMQARTTVAVVPALLDEVEGVSVTDNSKITFNAVENAVKYEFYVKRADGNFSLIDNFTVNDDGAETYTVNFTSNHLSAGVYEVAVRAVGDKMAGYFKSPLPNLSTSVVTVVID